MPETKQRRKKTLNLSLSQNNRSKFQNKKKKVLRPLTNRINGGGFHIIKAALYLI